MNPVLRLYRYGYPYRGCFAGAALAMIVYAGASGALAYQFKPIFDQVLPTGDGFVWVFSYIIGYSIL